MTDKKRIAEAVGKTEAALMTAKAEAEAAEEIAEKVAEKAAEKAAKEDGEAAPETEAEKPAMPADSAPAPTAGTGKLIDALLAAHAKIETLAASVNALSRENAELKAEAEKLSAPVDYAAAIENDESAEAAAIASPRVRSAVVAAYLRSLGNAEKVRVLTGEAGVIPLAPVAKPKSLAEAKKLAEILIKG